MTILKKVGHETERSERYAVFVDEDGAYWTYDPDGENGLLCSCMFAGRWVRS